MNQRDARALCKKRGIDPDRVVWQCSIGHMRGQRLAWQAVALDGAAAPPPPPETISAPAVNRY